MLSILETILSAWIAGSPSRFIMKTLMKKDRLSSPIAMMCHGRSELTYMYDVQTVMVWTVESLDGFSSVVPFNCLNSLLEMAFISAPLSSLK